MNAKILLLPYYFYFALVRKKNTSLARWCFLWRTGDVWKVLWSFKATFRGMMSREKNAESK